jgi:aconitate hydratase 2/2-methylisocitrate dehydratase
MSKGVAFGADSGTVALALATGEATMPIPQSVKVTFKGTLRDHMDFRDVVHATQAQMLKEFGENIFQGKVIEVHIGTLLSDQAFTFTDWTAEMKAKASICISQSDTLIASLEIAKDRIQIMIDRGMDNEPQVLRGLIDKAEARIAELLSGEKPALAPDANAQYTSEFVVDLDQIIEPMIPTRMSTTTTSPSATRTTRSGRSRTTAAQSRSTLDSLGHAWSTRAT